MRDASRYGSPPPPGSLRPCPLCAAPVPSARARYCSDACKQRAYRDRQRSASIPSPREARAALRRAGDLTRHTIYECPVCSERYLGERRCPECHRFCRALGLGGACPECDALVLLIELVPALDQAERR